jgi:phosphohistidine phosphatase SixA
MSRAAGIAFALLLALGLPLPAAWGDSAGGGQALRPKLAGQALVDALKQGGYVLLLRHTATEPVTPDPDLFDLSDCSTQRGLSEKGRSQAVLMGEAFRKLGIPVGEVLSSPYCRCLETGKLAFGRATRSEILSVADGLSVEEKSEWGGAVRKMLASPPKPGANTILITHTGTLLYSFGLNSRPEGVAHVFRPDESGAAVYVGMMIPEQWAELAGITAGTPQP